MLFVVCVYWCHNFSIGWFKTYNDLNHAKSSYIIYFIDIMFIACYFDSNEEKYNPFRMDAGANNVTLSHKSSPIRWKFRVYFPKNVNKNLHFHHYNYYIILYIIAMIRWHFAHQLKLNDIWLKKCKQET